MGYERKVARGVANDPAVCHWDEIETPAARGGGARINQEFVSGIAGEPVVPSVLDRVADIVAEQLGVDRDKISPETSFVNDLGADSLDTVELVMELEEEFDINIPDDAAEKIQTVGEAIHYIEQQVG